MRTVFLECPECGKEVKENWKFCPYCGEDLEKTDKKDPVCFTVNVEDLCDEEKNPNLSLSPDAIFENDKIPKKFR